LSYEDRMSRPGFRSRLRIRHDLSLAIVAVLAILAIPAGAGAGEPRSLAYVPNADDGTVSVISTSSREVIATVPVETRPISVAVSGTAFAYVANQRSGTVSVIDTKTSTVVDTVRVGESPADVAITPNGAFAYVTNFASNTVSVISTATNTVVATVPVTDRPIGVAIAPNGAFAYVTSSDHDAGSGRVSVINTSTMSVSDTFNVGARPAAVAFTPNGTFAYVINQLGFSFTMFPTADPNGPGGSGGGAGHLPNDLAVTPNGAFVYITNFATGLVLSSYEGQSVTVLSTSTNKLVDDIRLSPVGSEAAQGVAITPGGTFAYVGVPNAGTVAVIDTATNAVVDRIPVGGLPDAVAITPPVGALTLTQEDPASATIRYGESYSGRLSLRNVDGDVTYVQEASAHSTDLRVDSTGAISTGPKTLVPGTYTVNGTASDTAGGTGTWTFSLTVTPGTIHQGPPTEATIPNWTGYSTQLFMTDAVGAVTFTDAWWGTDAIFLNPAGLIRADRGLAPARYTAHGTATDSVGNTGTWSFTLTVVNPAGCGVVMRSVGSAPAVGTRVTIGQTISTGPNSSAEISTPEGERLILDADTEIVCDGWISDEEGIRSTLKFIEGAMYGLFVETSRMIGKGHEFEVCPPEGCPAGNLGIRGSAFTAAVLPGRKLLLHVIEGTGIARMAGRRAFTFPAGKGVLVSGRRARVTLRLPPGTASLIPREHRPPKITALRAKGKARRKAIVSFRLNESARITIHVRRGKRTLISLRRQAKKGANEIRLTKALPRGSYSVELVATHQGPTSIAMARLSPG
jgi:YVTN family beta-propeller protein